MPEERITAWLRVRDKLRFKEGMRSAAKSVRGLGEDTDEASRQTELLTQILKQLSVQNIQTSVTNGILAKSIDDVGDEASTTTRKLMALNAAQGLTNLHLRKSLTSWRFWKDRLSLTTGEIQSVVATIAVYLLPALVAMGASMAAAAMGGAAVLSASLGALAVGLGGVGLVASKVAGQYEKVATAQDAYNLSIKQYGAGSKEAARSAGKLFATIRTQGGRPVWQAVKAVRALGREWGAATGSARASLFGTLTSGISAARSMVPVAARQTNKNAASLQRGMGNIFGALSSSEARKTLVVLSRTFRAMMGPASRAGGNLIIIIMRIMRAAAPWAVKWAESWERTTSAWRRSTRDSSKLKGTIGVLVGHFKSWWALGKSLATTLRIIFTGTNAEGKKMVDVVTQYVDKFNRWLDTMVRTGQMQQLVQQYSRSIGYLFTALGLALTHPTQFIDKYLPIWADAIAQAAGSVVLTFLRAWWNSSLWGKLFITAMLAKWLFGLNLFAVVARMAAARFVTAFGIAAGPPMAALFGSGGLIGGAIAGAGARIGSSFASAFIRGITGVGLAVAMQKWVNDAARDAGILPEEGSGGGALDAVTGGSSALEHLQRLIPHIPGFASGGMIPSGTAAWVGERGPELAVAGANGAMIHPMGSSPAIAQPQRGALAVSDMLPPVHVHVDLNRREIGRANVNWNDERKSLRGER